MKNKIYVKDKEIIFNDVPRPILAKFRPIYRIAIIVMILYKCSRNKTASLMKLSFFNWILKSERNMNAVRMILYTGILRDAIKINLEPSFKRSLLLAKAEGFVEIYKSKYRLTDKGIKFGEEIFGNKDIFVLEKKFMKEVKTKIGEDKVEKFLEMRGSQDD
ncbi:hypothetical protein [Clostridium sp.]|jgi:hypothetical protein|uniref:hypothetical protein n=1 Tax=Clostridium sp. TaxID=1506 RepID=UPI002FDD5C00